jgi:hypothetical protein
MTAYGQGLPRDLLNEQRIQNGILNATLDILLLNRAPYTSGDLARSILRQAHECFAGTEHDGAFYVRRERGEFFLYPMGYWMESNHDWWRHWYHCKIDFELGIWVFEVMA